MVPGLGVAGYPRVPGEFGPPSDLQVQLSPQTGDRREDELEWGLQNDNFWKSSR